MDLSASDFSKILTKLETIEDILDWQADDPTPAKILPILRSCLKILRGYLDPDEISTTQLELFPDDVGFSEDEDEYNR